MTSSADLVRAQGFARRRLLAAFLSGGPGLHGSTPGVRWRALVTGLVLALLLMAAAAAMTLLTSREGEPRAALGAGGSAPRPGTLVPAVEGRGTPDWVVEVFA